jgi:hypothetical protein
VDNELSITQQNQMHQYLQTDAEAMMQWQLANEAKLVANKNVVLKTKMNLYAIANQEVVAKPVWNGQLKFVAGIALLIASTIGLYQFNFSNTTTNNDFAGITNTTNDTTIAIIKNSSIDSMQNVGSNNAVVNRPLIKLKNSQIAIKQNERMSKTNISKNKINGGTIQKEINNQNQMVKGKDEMETTTEKEIVIIESLQIQPMKSLKSVQNIQEIISLPQLKNIQIPKALQASTNSEINFDLPNTHFLDNNKAFQFFKKVNNTLALLNAERKNIKNNGVQLEFDMPEILPKKVH